VAQWSPALRFFLDTVGLNTELMRLEMGKFNAEITEMVHRLEPWTRGTFKLRNIEFGFCCNYILINI
jgi:hypothetical protein